MREVRVRDGIWRVVGIRVLTERWELCRCRRWPCPRRHRARRQGECRRMERTEINVSFDFAYDSSFQPFQPTFELAHRDPRFHLHRNPTRCLLSVTVFARLS